MRAKYFNYLYDECKRISKGPVDKKEIENFMDTTQGERCFVVFCRLHKQKKERSKRTHLSSIFEVDESDRKNDDLPEGNVKRII